MYGDVAAEWVYCILDTLDTLASPRARQAHVGWGVRAAKHTNPTPVVG